VRSHCGHVGSKSAATSSLASFKTVSLPSWLPAWHTILDVIGCLLTNRCQLEKLLLYGWVFGRFGKLPILSRLVPQIISPIHAAPSSTYLIGSGGEIMGCPGTNLISNRRPASGTK